MNIIIINTMNNRRGANKRKALLITNFLRPPPRAYYTRKSIMIIIYDQSLGKNSRPKKCLWNKKKKKNVISLYQNIYVNTYEY